MKTETTPIPALKIFSQAALARHLGKAKSTITHHLKHEPWLKDATVQEWSNYIAAYGRIR